MRAGRRTDPTLVELLIHCGTAAGGGAIDVLGSTSSTDMQVQATLAKVLGGTTDCTTSAGACVVGLARWEQDATVSSTFTPISFG